MSKAVSLLIALGAVSYCVSQPTVYAQEGMGEEQAQEKQELQNMKSEMQDIKSNINDAVDSMSQLKSQQAQTPQGNISQLYLIAKPASCEIMPGVKVDCLTYGGGLPGPVMRVTEGDMVRVVLQNQMKEPTSLLFQGLTMPQSVGGLPRQSAGMVMPGQGFAYQFVAKQAGTYWYHPQVNHAAQRAEGMSGLLIVEPRSREKSYDREILIVLNDVYARQSAPGHYQAIPPGAGVRHFSTMNGKSAPSIPPIQLNRGERIRLRVVNAGQQAVPLCLSGHHFEVVACNGSDPLEPRVTRDTITINPSDRYDLEFTADNPGVWSLASELYEQSTESGKFPGGLACIVRYDQQSAE